MSRVGKRLLLSYRRNRNVEGQTVKVKGPKGCAFA